MLVDKPGTVGVNHADFNQRSPIASTMSLHRDDPQHDEGQNRDEERHVRGHAVADLLHRRRGARQLHGVFLEDGLRLG